MLTELVKKPEDVSVLSVTTQSGHVFAFAGVPCLAPRVEQPITGAIAGSSDLMFGVDAAHDFGTNTATVDWYVGDEELQRALPPLSIGEYFSTGKWVPSFPPTDLPAGDYAVVVDDFGPKFVVDCDGHIKISKGYSYEWAMRTIAATMSTCVQAHERRQ